MNSAQRVIEFSINPDQLSDHLIPIFRSLGYLRPDEKGVIRIDGVEGPVPFRLINPEVEKESKKEGWVLLRIGEKKRPGLQKGS